MRKRYARRDDARVHPVDTVARIDADFRAALAYIKRSGQFRIDPWGQKLPGASEARLALTARKVGK